MLQARAGHVLDFLIISSYTICVNMMHNSVVIIVVATQSHEQYGRHNFTMAIYVEKRSASILGGGGGA